MSNSEALNERLSFMKLDAAAQASLRAAKPIIMRDLPGALDKFYAEIQRYPQTRKFFPDQNVLSGAKSRQIAHWEVISSGGFDQTYVQAVTRVGQVHARIGLEPRWYIGGYALVLDSLISSVLKARWPKASFGAAGSKEKEVAGELGGLVKAALLDMDYAISVYLEASETARLKAEAEVLAKERSTVVESVGAAMASLAAGDLTYRMVDNLPPEYLKIRDDFNAGLSRLDEAMGKVAASTGSIGASSDELAVASDDLSRRTEQQAAGLEETAAALDQITSTVKATADGALRPAASWPTPRMRPNVQQRWSAKPWTPWVRSKSPRARSARSSG